MNVDPRHDAALLSAYVDGELDAAEAARIEAWVAEDAGARREVERLHRLKALTGALRLKDAPPEVWEGFWQGAYNRSERSLGWLLLGLGVLVLAGWGATVLLRVVLGADGLPPFVKAAIIAGVAGLALLLVSVVRERIHARARTRYRDVVR
ncbi:MAG: zf-HC2 domain-containing protein [Krumholzibacteria bacterium]|nr:zf-HC2 domain-containing protein [Candidatus Krumholzibacteria bacterium]